MRFRRLLNAMKSNHQIAIIYSTLLAISLVGCTRSVELTVLPTDQTMQSYTPASVTDQVESPDVIIPPVAIPMVQITALDLAARWDLPVEEIILVHMEQMEWPDASIGCPEEGYDYAQVITPGYRITFKVDSQLVEYHTNIASYYVLCSSEFLKEVMDNDSTIKNGGPNETRDDDVIIAPPSDRK